MQIETFIDEIPNQIEQLKVLKNKTIIDWPEFQVKTAADIYEDVGSFLNKCLPTMILDQKIKMLPCGKIMTNRNTIGVKRSRARRGQSKFIEYEIDNPEFLLRFDNDYFKLIDDVNAKKIMDTFIKFRNSYSSFLQEYSRKDIIINSNINLRMVKTSDIYFGDNDGRSQIPVSIFEKTCDKVLVHFGCNNYYISGKNIINYFEPIICLLNKDKIVATFGPQNNRLVHIKCSNIYSLGNYYTDSDYNNIILIEDLPKEITDQIKNIFTPLNNKYILINKTLTQIKEMYSKFVFITGNF